MGLVTLLFTLVVIGGSIFWIWAIIDCATKESSEGNEKIIWLLIIIFVNFIGALIYYFVRRPERIRQYGR
ncbi:MAG: PLDc_N domain-containing protein [Bacteroidetes bacterium]|nr:PLDc_N domain-containing protein [Bacteroidota bacterium]